MSEREAGYLEEYDKRYLRMRNLLVTLLSIMGLIVSTLIAVGIPQVAKINANTTNPVGDISYNRYWIPV